MDYSLFCIASALGFVIGWYSHRAHVYDVIRDYQSNKEVKTWYEKMDN
jgi:Na+-transporting NADH:ubiquinone oxidoreductase subunit NqrF